MAKSKEAQTAVFGGVDVGVEATKMDVEVKGPNVDVKAPKMGCEVEVEVLIIGASTTSITDVSV